MTEPKSFASLTPSLLARKGAARPAMRPQLQPMHQFHEATARQIEEDLCWNAMGHDHVAEPVSAPAPPAGLAEVIAISPVVPAPEPVVPPVVRQQQAVAERIAVEKPAAERRSALAVGRRAAFTLRLDAERHLRLRLACTLSNRSAQQVVTEALDRLIAELPEVSSLAEQVRKRP